VVGDGDGVTGEREWMAAVDRRRGERSVRPRERDVEGKRGRRRREERGRRVVEETSSRVESC
jgi:hypothetical protein